MDPKQLRKQYSQHLPAINKALEHVQKQMADVSPSDFVLETNIKPYASVKRKMLDRNIRDPLELPDLVRGKLFYSEDYQPKEVVDLIRQLFKNKIKHIGKKDINDCGLAYPGTTDVNLDIDGVGFELQLMPMRYQPHQQLSHQIHDQLRNDHGKLTDVQKKFLQRTHNNLFQSLFNNQIEK
jgi:hypothetical protein